MKTEKKLSQIILYVDYRCPEDAICTFRTNMLEKRGDIWFTYLSYDKNIDINFLESFKFKDPKDDIVLITDSDELARNSHENGIGTIALLTEYNQANDFSGILYCIECLEDISYESIERIWQRFMGIPWEIVQTDRIIIREQTIDDLLDICEMYSDEETTLYMEDIYDVDEEREYMREYIASQYTFFEYGIWTLLDKSNGNYIGRAGLSIREGFDDIELGYVITKKYRNQGYAYEAVKAIIEYAGHELGIERLTAFVRPQNDRSIRILNKIGFKPLENHVIEGIIHVMYSFDL